MSAVTTKADQIRAGRLAHSVGGYDKLLRLAGERQRLGREGGQFERDADGRLTVSPVDRGAINVRR